MNQSRLQLRVGIFVILSSVAAAVMAFQFGELKSILQPRYTLSIHFDSAPGVYRSTPVRRNGIAIGSVSEVMFDEEQGGVVVFVDVREEFRIRKDAQPRLRSSLLGDASIDFVPGKSRQILAHGARLEGIPQSDPMQLVNRLEEKMSITLEAFHATSHAWAQVGNNLNNLLETNHGNLNQVIEQAAAALHQFTLTMQNANQTLSNANRVVGDPKVQENLRRTMVALPELVDETRKTITVVRKAVLTADQNLTNLNNVTGPLAKRSTSIVTRLDNTLGNLESISLELSDFTNLAAKENGTLHQFVADPELYRNLNRSAGSLSVLLRNLEPVVRDLRIFSDKVARHPELIGVRGALRGSSGLKDLPPDEQPRETRQRRNPRVRQR